MVYRQPAAGQAATNSTPASSSSVKPTGWIRSNSTSRPALTDRTNLPSGSRSTPSRSLPKSVVQNAARRSTPVTSGVASKQQKLSRFFAPNTAPPAADKAGPSRLSAFQDSPSVVRARVKSAAVEIESKLSPALDDDELEARAASLLRGRFGSFTRSLNPTRSSTPTRAPSPPRSDPEAPRRDVRPTMQPPPVQNHRQPPLRALESKTTPPRPARVEQHLPSSSPPFEPTLMAESLSNFTPPAWERAYSSKAAMFKRLAGVSREEIFDAEKANMADQLARAHARMRVRPLESSKRRAAPAPAPAVQREKLASPRKNRIMQAAALTSSPPKERASRQPEAVMRSPRTNRRIYALETQVEGAPGMDRALSFQPLRSLAGADGSGEPAAKRKAVSEARYSAAGPSISRQVTPPKQPSAPEVEEEEESETQPLPWPAEDEDIDMNAAADGVADGDGDETQPLPWEDDADDLPNGFAVHPSQGDRQARDDPQAAVTEVPPSDDEDLLQQKVFPSSSSSSPSSSPSPSPSASRRRSPALQNHLTRSPPAKRPRIKLEHDPPTTSRTRPVHTPTAPRPPPTISPIALANAPERFSQIVAALRKGERRRHNGMQLNLHSYLSSSPAVQPGDAEKRRQGLSDDLHDVLSDDEDGGDTTVTSLLPSREDETQPLPWDGGEVTRREDETQPLAWDESATQVEPIRPGVAPLQNSSPVRSQGTSSSSSSGIVPSQNSLNTQLRGFLHDL